MKKFEILEHTADLAIKGLGKDLPELFSNLAQGMYSVITEEKGRPKGKTKEQKIEVRGEDPESLLINFLNELLFLSETKRLRFHNFKFLQFSDQALSTLAYTTPLLQEKMEIKAATFHDLKIIKVNNHCQATVIFDI